MPNQQTFFKDMQGYAITSAALLGMPYEVILCQWALESTYGTSDVAIRSKNLGGIKYTKNADFQSGSYAGYNSYGSFVKDYVRVMSLSYYSPVRAAGSIRETIEAFDRTPYAEDSSYSKKILSIYETNKGMFGVGQGAAGTIASVTGGLGRFLMNPILWAVFFVYMLFKKRRG